MDFSSFSYFNPRLREGGDNSTRLSINSCFVFQSTPPRRRRPQLTTYTRNSSHFNPRLREGGDAILLTLICLQENFNPRLREGGDEYAAYQAGKYTKFQSTPPRRRRLQHIVIPQLSCTYLVSTTFLSAIFSFISQYIVLFFLF